MFMPFAVDDMSASSTCSSAKKSKKDDATTKFGNFLGTLENGVEKRMETKPLSENESFFNYISVEMEPLPKKTQLKMKLKTINPKNVHKNIII